MLAAKDSAGSSLDSCLCTRVARNLKPILAYYAWNYRRLLATLSVCVAFVYLVILFYTTKQQLITAESEARVLKETVNALIPFFNERLMLENGMIPMVMYVASRPQYYRQVLEKLRTVHNIHKTMLFVSHDAVNDEMLKITQSIDFCQVLLSPCRLWKGGEPHQILCPRSSSCCTLLRAPLPFLQKG